VSIAEDPPKLVIVNTLPSNPNYATLSYCWGTKQNVCLRRDTLASFTTAIPVAKLPKTLTDALAITKALALSYVWIDALCIIQDDHNDWLTESAKMRSIYGGSRINIAARSSRDV
jgi:hypothetical protein